MLLRGVVRQRGYHEASCHDQACLTEDLLQSLKHPSDKSVGPVALDLSLGMPMLIPTPLRYFTLYLTNGRHFPLPDTRLILNEFDVIKRLCSKSFVGGRTGLDARQCIFGNSQACKKDSGAGGGRFGTRTIQVCKKQEFTLEGDRPARLIRQHSYALLSSNYASGSSGLNAGPA